MDIGKAFEKLEGFENIRIITKEELSEAANRTPIELSDNLSLEVSRAFDTITLTLQVHGVDGIATCNIVCEDVLVSWDSKEVAVATNRGVSYILGRSSRKEITGIVAIKSNYTRVRLEDYYATVEVFVEKDTDEVSIIREFPLAEELKAKCDAIEDMSVTAMDFISRV